MSRDYDLVALVTLLALAFFFWTTIRVGMGRAKFGVAAPATTGHADFDRLFRVQMNTLEGLVLFIPALWLSAFYWGGLFAAAAGTVWLIGRVLYAIGYARAAEQRGPGFGIQMLATLTLLIAALAGATRMLAGWA